MNDSWNRREFLGSAGAAAVAVAASAAAAEPVAFASGGDDAGAIPIVDTHVHLWDPRRFHLAWLKGAPTLDRSYSLDDYRRASQGLNVVKAIYMEVDVDPSQHEREARTIAAICRRGDAPLVAAVISGRPASAGFAPYIRPLAAEPAIKGLRQVLHSSSTPPGYCLDPAFVKGIRLLGELGLSFDLCLRSAELDDGARISSQCPETRFILDHCGNADVFARDLTPWKRSLAALARRPNVCAKVSGIVASTRGRPWRPDDLAPIINHVLDSFGPDRVVFGGDWPVCTLGAPLADWVKALRQVVAARPAAEQRKLFHENAVKIYRLDKS